MPRRVPVLAALLVLGAAVALAGCAPSYGHQPAADGRVRVVASTDVYGSIASAIGGDRVDVTSIIDTTAKDPHEYEVTAQDRLAVTRADLVVYNGGGYDAFMYPLLADTGVAKVDAAVAAGRLTANGNGDGGTDAVPTGFNEHVFYDLAGMEGVATAIGDELARIDPGSASVYAANAAAFTASLDGLVGTERAIAAAGCGRFVMTEPVPGYLLEAAGCTDATPADFSKAVEEGTGVPATVLRETLNAIGCGRGLSFDESGSVLLVPGPACLPDQAIRLVAVNPQDAGPETKVVSTAAGEAGVPVVEFTETLPDGYDYLAWMTANVDAVRAAVTASST